MKLLYILILTIFISPTAIQAKDADLSSEEPDTRIEADQDADEIRFIIDGNVVGVMTEDGLRVHGDLTGKSFFHKREAEAEDQTEDGLAK